MTYDDYCYLKKGDVVRPKASESLYVVTGLRLPGPCGGSYVFVMPQDHELPWIVISYLYDTVGGLQNPDDWEIVEEAP